MSESPLVMAEYEIELASEPTLQALAADLAATPRRPLDLGPEVVEQLRRKFFPDE